VRIKIHQEYFYTILLRDLVERHDVSHPKAIADLAPWQQRQGCASVLSPIVPNPSPVLFQIFQDLTLLTLREKSDGLVVGGSRDEAVI
jgi:hypothetical protein